MHGKHTLAVQVVLDVAKRRGSQPIVAVNDVEFGGHEGFGLTQEVDHRVAHVRTLLYKVRAEFEGNTMYVYSIDHFVRHLSCTRSDKDMHLVSSTLKTRSQLCYVRSHTPNCDRVKRLPRQQSNLILLGGEHTLLSFFLRDGSGLRLSNLLDFLGNCCHVHAVVTMLGRLRIRLRLECLESRRRRCWPDRGEATSLRSVVILGSRNSRRWRHLPWDNALKCSCVRLNVLVDKVLFSAG
mmetsp:Transcript_53979/g.132338  ORF Transcript_53979/g.132338 Transcript_53979/m.132338 type:complete len:238 (+) Transcript_53979:1085-1798(+)